MAENPEYYYSLGTLRISKKRRTGSVSLSLLRFLAALPGKRKLTFIVTRIPVLNGQVKAAHKLPGSSVPRTRNFQSSH